MEPGPARGLRREAPEVGGAQSRRSSEAEGPGGGWGSWVTQMPTLRRRDLCRLSQCAPRRAPPRCWVSRALFSFSTSAALTRLQPWSKKETYKVGVWPFLSRVVVRCLNFLRKAKVYSH